MMIWSLGIATLIGVSMGLPFSHAGTGGDGGAIGPATSSVTAPVPLSTTAETGKLQEPSASMPMEGTLILRTLPTVSRQLSVGGATLMPYVGAGFGGGYATEIDRSLTTSLSAPSSSSNLSDTGMKGLAGQMIPNEVQLGIRFPF
ncbi:MAG: hypothetical protein H8K03_19035 [Nitrospira sp.]